MFSLILIILAIVVGFWLVTLLPAPAPVPLILQVLLGLLLIYVLLNAAGVAPRLH